MSSSESSTVPTSSRTPTTAGSGLFPGYKHVEQFGPDEDYEELGGGGGGEEEEEEECYVTLDLSNVDQTLVPSSSSYRLIGLDTPTPFLQLSGTIMKGHYQTLIGTELIFKDVSEEADAHPAANTNANSNAQYFTKTNRRILFREVTLKPKTVGKPSSRTHESPPVSGESAGDHGTNHSNTTEQETEKTMHVDADAPESTVNQERPESADVSEAEASQASQMEVDI